MPLYLTQYPLDWPGTTAKGGAKTTLFARDYVEAEAFCKARKLGEVLIDPAEHITARDASVLNHMRPEMPSDLLRRRRYSDALHAGAFLSFVGLKSGYLQVEELLGDVSPVHELAHWVMFRDMHAERGAAWKPPSAEVLMSHADRLEIMERQVPGFHPRSISYTEPRGLPIESWERAEAIRQWDLEKLAGFADDYPRQRRIVQRQRKKRAEKIARLENA
ncbi:hypothetical protein CcrKarma_gp309 [Caulobacter virus Karma]|uniref:hypothetical protein n=1 Tax=Caulobacter virus Karma TaxID=1211641 RepID=UPI00028AB70B|nr:hypothetical protein CcrKarma_gp309 [Caulobacter virus Karma]AFU87826.1 hypothetical protein CcrKarma_gp309 [Caulobacter virus Karma]